MATGSLPQFSMKGLASGSAVDLKTCFLLIGSCLLVSWQLLFLKQRHGDNWNRFGISHWLLLSMQAFVLCLHFAAWPMDCQSCLTTVNLLVSAMAADSLYSGSYLHAKGVLAWSLYIEL
jgi:hypothetical protein